MILISKTYSEVTPESAEDGDYSDTGFVYENAEFTFRELARAMLALLFLILKMGLNNEYLY